MSNIEIVDYERTARWVGLLSGLACALIVSVGFWVITSDPDPIALFAFCAFAAGFICGITICRRVYPDRKTREQIDQLVRQHGPALFDKMSKYKGFRRDPIPDLPLSVTRVPHEVQDDASHLLRKDVLFYSLNDWNFTAFERQLLSYIAANLFRVGYKVGTTEFGRSSFACHAIGREHVVNWKTTS